MTAAPVLRAAWAGTTRRLVQSLVVLVVLAAASAVALTGLTLAAGAAPQASNAAGAVTRTANLPVTIDAAKVSAASGTAASGTAAAGRSGGATGRQPGQSQAGPSSGSAGSGRPASQGISGGGPRPGTSPVTGPSGSGAPGAGTGPAGAASDGGLPRQLPGVGPASASNNANTPFVLAFAVLGLVLAVLITANVVFAAVIASYRRIGVLKSIGFTPAQVAAVFLTQTGIPAVAGTVAGTVLGNWMLPSIGLAPTQLGRVSVPLWINLAVPLGMLALTGLAAAVPAVRAGRLSAVAAITAGQAPPAGRGALPYRLAAGLGLPEPVTIGLAAPFSRPARSAVTLAALTFGLTGVVLGTSLNSSVDKINHSAIQGFGQLQVVDASGGQPKSFTAGQAAAVQAAIRAQPGTLHDVAETDLFNATLPDGLPASSVKVGVVGQPGALSVAAYSGDSSWLGWSLISGRWYSGPGQVDVSETLAAGTGRTVGDSITLTVNGHRVTVRIAGEVFIPNATPTVFVSWQTLGAPAAGLKVDHYDIGVKPGTSMQAYTGALRRALGTGYLSDSVTLLSGAAGTDTSLFWWLTVLVAVLAGLGVLNAAFMATRERVHDLGVFKAVGMTPRQSIAMVVCWVIAPAVIAAAIALPAGLIIEDILVDQVAAGFVLPGSFVHVLGGADLLLLALAGLVLAVAGALGPATWTARSRTSAALYTE